MILTEMSNGIGNQLFKYAAGRRLAHKLNTELKLDVTFYEHVTFCSYNLNLFNIDAAIATPEEIAGVKNSRGGGLKQKTLRSVNLCRKF